MPSPGKIQPQQRLEGRPDRQHGVRRRREDSRPEGDEQREAHAGAREGDGEGAHATGDGARGADERHGVVRVEAAVRERRHRARRHVEERKDDAPPAVLEGHPAEDEEPHVAREVHPAGVDERCT